MGKVIRVAVSVVVLYLAFLAFHFAPGTEDTIHGRNSPDHPRFSLESRLENSRLGLRSFTNARIPPGQDSSSGLLLPTTTPAPAPTLAPMRLGVEHVSAQAQGGLWLSSRPRMTCNSTKGPFVVSLNPDLCPRSVRQIVTMLQAGFFAQGLSFWRVNEWITQFGADESPAARQKRGATDPYSHVRKGLGNDPHPACQAAGYDTVRACKDASNELEVEETEEGSASKVLSEKMAGPALVAARKAGAWRRGTWAVIGGTHFVVVRGANTDMGTAAHDCPAGEVLEEAGLEEQIIVHEKGGKGVPVSADALKKGMIRVFDRLYSGYGNFIDNRGPLKKTGPDQRDIFRSGLSYMTTNYPLLDTLVDCSMSAEDVKYVINATAAFAVPGSGG